MIFICTENTTSLGTNSNWYNKNLRKQNLTSVQNRESNQISPLRDWNIVLTFKRYLNSDWFSAFPFNYLNENLSCWKIFPVAVPQSIYIHDRCIHFKENHKVILFYIHNINKFFSVLISKKHFKILQQK